MATFAGIYVTEPSDFYVVGTEKGLIELADDPGAIDPILKDRFVDLTPEELDQVVAVWDEIILTEEAVVNSYLRAAGISTPMQPPDRAIQDAVVNLAWLAGLYRKGHINADDYRQQREHFTRWLELVAKGVVSIVVGDVDSGPAVYRVTSQERVFTRCRLEDFG